MRDCPRCKWNRERCPVLITEPVESSTNNRTERAREPVLPVHEKGGCPPCSPAADIDIARLVFRLVFRGSTHYQRAILGAESSNREIGSHHHSLRPRRRKYPGLQLYRAESASCPSSARSGVGEFRCELERASEVG